MAHSKRYFNTLSKGMLVDLAFELSIDVDKLNAQLADMTAYADRLAAGLPDGMLPKDVEILRDANGKFAQQLHDAQARISELENGLRSLYQQEHDECDDCWCSCPKSEGGCCDEDAPNECNCGKDKNNEIISKLLEVKK